MSNSGLPSPPLADKKLHLSRKTTKPPKLLNRSTKRSSSSHEHDSVVLEERHKRVWKACERCRMKKTKCDGESPCQKCKDDGLVCTAGSRKKTGFKQLPPGYAEVLENTQYALIATVQRLYSMVRNGERWDLGEPELNDRGQPVIHDIASRLACIRASPDLAYAFPEGEQDPTNLQAQLRSARSGMALKDTGGRKHSKDSSSYSPRLQRTDRESSSESDHSSLSRDHNQMMWAQRQGARKIAPRKPAPLSFAQKLSFEEKPVYQPRPSLDTTCSMPSPIYPDYQTESSMFHNASPLSPWAGIDEFLGSAHALDLTALYMRQQIQIPRSSPLASQGGFDADALKATQMNDGLNFADGTIRPNMLDCNTGYDIDQIDSIMFTGDYEA